MFICFFQLSGSDFTANNVSVTIAPTQTRPSIHELPHVFVIIDDAVNENDEVFVIVAEVGTDTPDDVVCFLRDATDTACHGRMGVASVEIAHNDGWCECRPDEELLVHNMFFFISRNVHWIYSEESDSI